MFGAGIIIIVTGLVMFARFVRRNPNLENQ